MALATTLTCCSRAAQPVSTMTPAQSAPAPAATFDKPTTNAGAPPAPPPLDNGAPTAGQTAPLDNATASQARSRATAFMRAFARTDLPQQSWWQGLAGFLTPAAAPIYQYIDVANVPVRRITETTPTIGDGATKYRVTVNISTNIGIYVVTLIRATGAWLVDRAEPAK
jgi:hypothetical protein